MKERKELEQAIANLESQRPILGDSTTDAAISAIQAQLTARANTPQQRKQRKQITVLFADVSGFTAMSETMDAEDVSDTMNALWRTIDSTILEYGGRVDKHIGDGVMALWGVESTQEDDPKQAIKAALAMQQAIRTFSDAHTINLKMRIGLNTGAVLLDQVGNSDEFTAMGDTVNIAARLEAAAPIGGVLISHACYQHVRGVFDVNPQEPLMVKGKAEPLHAYVVNHLKSNTFRTRSRGVEGVKTRMVGRDNELQALRLAWQTATSTHLSTAVSTKPQTTLITIVGDAGVGKSRLLHEFEQWLEQQPITPHILKGRSTEQTTGTSYFLLRDTLRRQFGIQESDPIAVVHQKMEVGMAAFLADEPVKKAHFLGQWLGHDFSHSPHITAIGENTEQLRSRGLLYLAHYITAVSQTAPTAILLEDIHWADMPSLTAFIDLIQRQSALPLLVVCLTRPSLFAEQPDWPPLRETETAVHLDLSPLATSADRELLSEILRHADHIPERLFNLVASRAEGNPFYMEELINMLIDTGVIITDSNLWQIDMSHLDERRIPGTLTGVLQARLDKLNAAEKATLQRASVVGRVFWNTAVQQLGEQPDHAALHPLQGRELIFQRGNSAFIGTVEYLFKHDLLRDVTYQSVLKRARKVYHKQVAEWLVNAATANGRIDEYTAVIADHFDLAEQWNEAQDWYRRAGEQAATQYNNEDAIRYLSRCLELTVADDTETQFNLLLIREGVYAHVGNREAQGEDLAQLEQLADTRQQVGEQSEIAWRQAGYSHNPEDKLVLSQKAVDLARTAGDKGKEGRGEAMLAWVRYSIGEVDISRIHTQRAITLHQVAGEPVWEARVLMNSALREMGDGGVDSSYARAQQFLERAFTIAQKLNHQDLNADISLRLAILHAKLGNYAQSRDFNLQGLHIYRELGAHANESLVLNNLGYQLPLFGNHVEAELYLQQALQIQKEINHSLGSPFYNLGLLHMNLEEYDKAQHYLDLAEIEFSTLKEWVNHGWALKNLAYISYHRCQYTDAEALYTRALAICQRLKFLPGTIEIQTGLAQTRLAVNDLVQAETLINDVLAFLQANVQFGRLGEIWQFRMYLSCYQVLAGLNRSEAPEILDRAYRYLQARAANMPDEIRQMFLGNVATHRQLVAAWEEMQG